MARSTMSSSVAGTSRSAASAGFRCTLLLYDGTLDPPAGKAVFVARA